MTKTIIKITPDEATQRAAAFACQIQDACNGRAILAALLRHLDAMRAADDSIVSDLRNQHPVLIAVWLITEWDRSATTILLSREY